MENSRFLAKGVVVSNDTRITKLNNNDLIIGSSGSGKTGGYVIPNIQNISGSMVISDTKGQLYKMFRNKLENKGYKVCLIDLVNPLNSCGYNPLNFIRKYDNGKHNEQDILTLANTIMPVLNRYDPFWEMAAAGYLAFLISFCLDALEESEHNMISVCKLHQSFIKKNGTLLFDKWVEENPDTFTAKKFYQLQAIFNADKMWSSIVEFANRALELFMFEEAKSIFENTINFNIIDLGREKTVLFINNSDTDRTFDRLANIFYTQALQRLCYEADMNPDGRLKVPVRIIMDDFASGTKIPDFDKIISVIRSRDISVSLILQSLTQLESMYSSSEAMTIVNNCDHILCLGSQDKTTAEFVSYRLQKTPESIFELPRDMAVLITSGEKAAVVEKIEAYSTVEV